MSDELPEVNNAADIAANEGQMVQVIGTYQLFDVRKGATPPPVHKGHAVVALADGTRVCLRPPWAADAIRPQQERDRFNDEKVAVAGIVMTAAPADPSGGASIVMPCVTMVAGVVSHDLYEMSK